MIATRLHLRPISATRLFRVAGLLTALLLGVLIAWQSLEILIAGFGLFALLLLGLITPTAAVATMLIIAPLRTLMATESSFQLPLDIGQLSVMALIGIWIIHKITNKQRLLSISWSPVFAPMIIFLIALSLTIFSAENLNVWLSEWLKWSLILLLALLVTDIMNQGGWHWLVFALVASAATNAIIGLYIFFGGSGADHLHIGNGLFRAFGTFGQPNPFGGFMGLIAPIALMSAYAYGQRLYQYWRIHKKPSGRLFLFCMYYLGTAFLISAGLFASWSRGAWIGFIVSLAMIAFALPRKLWQSLLMGGIIISVIGILWFTNILPTSVVARVTNSAEEFFAFEDVRGFDITSENFAIVERLAHWQAALNMAETYPWLGVGLGNYEIAYTEYRLLNWHEPLGHAHNYYLNILAEAGMIGFLAYVILWASLFWSTWRIRYHPNTLARAIGIGLLGTWTYLSVHSLLDNLYVNNLFLHMGVMVGIVAILNRQTWNSLKVEIT